MRGREVIECDCNENYLDRGARGQFCIDLTETRYQDIINGVRSGPIYAYSPNNHGERCPPVDFDSSNKDDGSSCGVGNPCSPATGNKFQSETDISANLSFVRYYNSRNLIDLGLGKGWRSTYQKRLAVRDNITFTLVSEKGRGERWSKVTGIWIGDADSDVKVESTSTGYILSKQNGSVDEYSMFGRLISETDTNGNQTVYGYNSDDQLIIVTNHYGQSLAFAYDANDHLETVTDSNGTVYKYQYDANDNLRTVIYPDSTLSDNDNPTRGYHYDDTNYPSHLTGITDESGDRYATWAYNADGKAIMTQHAETTNSSAQEKFALDYQD